MVKSPVGNTTEGRKQTRRSKEDEKYINYIDF